jgi:hypothetical protein
MVRPTIRLNTIESPRDSGAGMEASRIDPVKSLRAE